jgi:propionate CoA-transferase
VGLGTFVDPRLGGGKINARTTEELVRLMEIDGEDYLFYKAFPIHVGIIRATTADPDGNLTMEREALTLEALAIAMAAHNSGGIVIAQVERIAERGSLNPRRSRSPACWSTAWWWPTEAGAPHADLRHALQPGLRGRDPRAVEPRWRRCRWRAQGDRAPRRAGTARNAWSTWASACPRAWPAWPPKEQIIDLLTLTAEPGVIGGIPASGLNFGAAVNTQAIIDQPSQFDFYDGGGLDIAVLGLAQADRRATSTSAASARGWPAPAASSTSARTPRRWSSSAPSPPATCRCIVAAGGCTSQRGHGAQVRAEVEQRTFSGERARQRGQRVLYVTERCVFRLADGGLELIEIAPGIDLERDILAQMDFGPPSARTCRLMDARLFADAPLGLRERLLTVPLAAAHRATVPRPLLFINFEGLRVDDGRRHRRDRSAA